MHIHLLCWHNYWSVQKMFISFVMSLDMGSIVAKTGCKMQLFLVQPDFLRPIVGIIGMYMTV
jgi:hypothetical protein